jgi:hypothetical protein
MMLGVNLLQVQYLVGFLVQALGAGLAGDGHQRRVVHVGVGHAGDEVGGPRSQGADADPGLAGEAAVDIGHEGGALFVAGGDEADIRVQQGVHDVQVFLAGNTEDVFHTFVFQTLHEQIGCLHSLTSLP